MAGHQLGRDVHPLHNIRGVASDHLSGRRIVLGVSGSIAAVKTVELARELARHGAEVHAVMTPAATRIVHPDALQFATGNPVITRLTGAVEHVALLGDVPEKADLLLLAPVTANTVAKAALGIDDSPVTTCVTVAVGTQTPILIAPAMHQAMLDHPVVGQHGRALVEMGMGWVEPRHDEKKAKLADIDVIVEAVIHRLAARPGPGPRGAPPRPGPLAGKRALVVSGATAEPVDAVRVLTNRSSGRSGHLLALELMRHGAEVELWQGEATAPLPSPLEERTRRFTTHADLMALVEGDELAFDQVWMPAAINDYAPVPEAGKIASGQDEVALSLRPLGKVIQAIRQRAPEALLVAFKAEADPERLEAQARDRMERHGAAFVVGNTAAAFGADETRAVLFSPDGEETFEGDKADVLRAIVRSVARQAVPA